MKIYDFVGTFFNDFKRVRVNYKWGVIDKNDNEICECKYDDIYYYMYGYTHMRIDNKWGFIDNDCNEVIPCVYAYVESFVALDIYKLNLIRIKKLKTII